MYILEPVQHTTIWGGKQLCKYISNPAEKIGHLYMVDGHENMTNKIINGKYAHKTIREVFSKEKDEWGMAEYDEFPLTIALVDAAQNLSIQVHPDGVLAEQIEKKNIGKTESWLFLKAPLSGWIYNGCDCSTSDEVQEAVRRGKMEEITHRMPVNEYEYVRIEAGTLHAMTAGSLVYEIEYGSDYTYRFYDYNRTDKEGNKRELHIEKALKAIKPDLESHSFSIKEGEWISEEDYEICMICRANCYKNRSHVVEVFSLIDGQGVSDNCQVNAGMSILLLPGEELNGFEIGRAIVARLRSKV